MNLQYKRLKELFGYARTLTREQGLGTMLNRAAGFAARRLLPRHGRYLPGKKALAAQRAQDTAAFPLISILTPLYNTPPKYLEWFLDSVQAQTCGRWQLCLADASDSDHAAVGEAVRRRAAADPRIKYVKIDNAGIAANTNRAAELADGEYLALADHDDELAPHAIYTMGRAIREAERSGAAPQFLYSDEALFRHTPKDAHVAHFKPDYAPEYLMACNYICHLAVFRRELFQAVGGERPECDGAQDHDLFLRMIDEMQRTDPRRGAGAYTPGTVLLAGACGLHQRRDRSKALCDRRSPEGGGRPSGCHRTPGQCGGGQVPGTLPCAVDAA